MDSSSRGGGRTGFGPKRKSSLKEIEDDQQKEEESSIVNGQKEGG